MSEYSRVNIQILDLEHKEKQCKRKLNLPLSWATCSITQNNQSTSQLAANNFSSTASRPKEAAKCRALCPRLEMKKVATKVAKGDDEPTTAGVAFRCLGCQAFHYDPLIPADKAIQLSLEAWPKRSHQPMG